MHPCIIARGDDLASVVIETLPVWCSPFETEPSFSPSLKIFGTARCVHHAIVVALMSFQ